MAGAIWTRCRTCWTDGVAYQCKNCPANNSIKDRFKVIRTEAKELYAPVDIEVHKGLVGSASLLLLKGYLFVKISIRIKICILLMPLESFLQNFLLGITATPTLTLTYNTRTHTLTNN